MAASTPTSTPRALRLGLAAAALAAAVTATTGATTTSTATAAAASDQQSAGSSSTTTVERGIVLDCTGSARGLRVWTSVYENDPHGNVFEVVLGRPEDGNRRAKESARGFWDGRRVKAATTVRGKRLTVTGTAVKVGRRTAVREEMEDGGEHLVMEGHHRRLRHDLVLRYGATRVPLTCSDAFAYRLRVTREPVA